MVRDEKVSVIFMEMVFWNVLSSVIYVDKEFNNFFEEGWMLIYFTLKY